MELKAWTLCVSLQYTCIDTKEAYIFYIPVSITKATHQFESVEIQKFTAKITESAETLKVNLTWLIETILQRKQIW
jgi:hypothetical protein